VTEVLNHHTCQLRGAGVRQVQHADLPRLRGARLLVEPGADKPDPRGDDKRILVAVSRGSKPTPGYALSLESASQTGDVIRLEYEWEQPDPNAVLAQVMTHPCSVVALDDPTETSLKGLTVEAWVSGEKLAGLILE
jgi:hypothetical protein